MAERADFVGIDLTLSPRKPSAYVAFGSALEVAYLGSFRTDPEILEAITRHRPSLVAIDAPLSLPLGLCCLKEDCPCQQHHPEKGRACERELRKLRPPKGGISSFYTTKKSFVKEWVDRGIDLKKKLTCWGYEVLEVYPYATKVLLFGKGLPKKTSSAGIRVLRDHLSRLLPQLAPCRLGHDLCDALLGAYTAYLQGRGRAEGVGDPQEGLIFIPRVF